ncbi:MAG: ComF family protein [Chloroflexota bacterium]
MALDLLFPQRCLGCGKAGILICPSCQSSLPILAPPLCPLCGRPQLSGILCSDCIRWQAEIDGIRSPFRFDGVTRQAIHQLKYRNLRTLAAPLARLLNSYLAGHPVPGDVLVPVPLHPKRLKERGYNQSALLANELGKLTNLPIIEDCLVRRQHTSPQAKTATVDERRSNVSEAFVCRSDGLRNRQVILIDDVATSGATLNACAQALKAAGAISVWGLVMAREI